MSKPSSKLSKTLKGVSSLLKAANSKMNTKKKTKSSTKGPRMAPTAFDFAAPTPRFSVVSQKDGGCRVSGCDLVGPVGYTPDVVYLPGDTLLNFAFNCDLVASSRLSRQAALYQKFKFVKARFCYVPVVGSNNSGSIVMGVIRDPKLPVPASWGENGLQTLYASPGCDSGVIWDTHDCTYSADKATNWCFTQVSPTSTEPYQLYPGQFVMLTQTVIDQDSTVPPTFGNLFIEYVVDLQEPALNTPPVGVNQFSNLNDASFLSPFAPNLTAPEAIDNSSNLNTVLESTSADGTAAVWASQLGQFLETVLFKSTGWNSAALDLCNTTVNDGSVVPTIKTSVPDTENALPAEEGGVFQYLVDLIPAASSVATAVNKITTFMDPAVSLITNGNATVDWLATTAIDLLGFAATRGLDYHFYRGGNLSLFIHRSEWKDLLLKFPIILRCCPRRAQLQREVHLFPQLRRFLDMRRKTLPVKFPPSFGDHCIRAARLIQAPRLERVETETKTYEPLRAASRAPSQDGDYAVITATDRAQNKDILRVDERKTPMASSMIRGDKRVIS